MDILECTHNLTTPIKSMTMSAPGRPKNASVPQEHKFNFYILWFSLMFLEHD